MLIGFRRCRNSGTGNSEHAELIQSDMKHDHEIDSQTHGNDRLNVEQLLTISEDIGFEDADSVSVLPRCGCRKRFRLTSSYPLSPVPLKLERRQANSLAT
jgi:hypothetical protein